MLAGPRSNLYRLVPLMAVILMTLGCSYSFSELSMYRPALRSLDHPALTRVFQERAAIEVVEVASVAGVSPVDALESRMADLALFENSTPFRQGLRSILPIYGSVLHIMVDEQYRRMTSPSPFAAPKSSLPTTVMPPARCCEFC